jgi:acetyl esterase/lipase
VNLERYPAQEPLSALGVAYQQRVLRLCEGIAGLDVAYGPDPYQSLSVFRPTRASGDVLVFFHGGGWTNGYKEWMFFMAPALLKHGITFVSAGYRLAPQHVFPIGYEDCADALAWVLTHIAKHGGNPARVFVGGHSAGGHYAALLAVTAPWRVARGLPAQALRGCLPVSGVYRFGAGSGMTLRPRFLGPLQDGRAELAAAPLAQLNPASCPSFLITHGSRDFPHLIVQAGEMATALRAARVPVQVEVLEDCDHFEASVACGEPNGKWAAMAAAWMQAVDA